MDYLTLPGKSSTTEIRELERVTSKLRITNADSEDGGRYSCQASNAFGVSNFRVQVTIWGNSILIQFYYCKQTLRHDRTFSPVLNHKYYKIDFISASSRTPAHPNELDHNGNFEPERQGVMDSRERGPRSRKHRGPVEGAHGGLVSRGQAERPSRPSG